MDNVYISREAISWNLFSEDFKTFHLYINMMFDAFEKSNTGMVFCHANDVAKKLKISTKELERRLDVLEKNGLIRSVGDGFEVFECKYVRFTPPMSDEG